MSLTKNSNHKENELAFVSSAYQRPGQYDAGACIIKLIMAVIYRNYDCNKFYDTGPSLLSQCFVHQAKWYFITGLSSSDSK
jgi:hypothetical protein